MQVTQLYVVFTRSRSFHPHSKFFIYGVNTTNQIANQIAPIHASLAAFALSNYWFQMVLQSPVELPAP